VAILGFLYYILQNTEAERYQGTTCLACVCYYWNANGSLSAAE